MQPAPRRRLAATITTSSLALAALALTPSAHAASPDLVVAEAYGGGGNSGAPYASDFIEVFNRGSAPVDLTGWSVQYWSASGTTAQRTPLTGTIAPGRHYLVKEADGANTSAAPLPTPDATGTIAMSSSAGRVAVVNPAGQVVDLVGYGNASASEGGTAPATSNTTSVSRTNPCVDTDNNAADFTAGTPAPQTSATAAVTCTDGPPPPTGVVATVAEVQGAAHISPLNNQLVRDVAGVVTAVTSNGFWIQSTTPDQDPATSEGVFVFSRTAPTVAVGDAVTVAGTVTEFRSGGSGGNDNLTTTEIASPKVTTTSSGNPLPTAVVLGVDRVAPAQTVEAGNPGSVEKPGVPFDPATSAIDFDESLEGMRVGVRDAVATGPTNESYGELPVVPGQQVQAQRSRSGGVVYGGYDQPNSQRIILDDPLLPKGAMPVVNVGDTLTGDTVGVMDYGFGNFKLLATQVGTASSAGLQRETTATQTNNQLAVATFNVENLAPSDPATKYERLAGQITHNLASPDVLALEEIQDNSGAADDGTVDSSATVDKLVTAIKDAGGPAYEARWIDPQNDTDGGQPGGNIRQVFLYRPDRDVEFVDVTGGDATTPTTVVGTGKGTTLSASPGRIDPANPAWNSSRKPLVGQFRFRGKSVFVIANHFASKGGDDPLFGRWQQPTRFSEAQRHEQSRAVRGFVDKLLSADAQANVVVLGDLNDFEFSETANILVGSGSTALTDLPRTLPANERYSYVFDGNSQVLDHILISPALLKAPAGSHGPAYSYDIVHTNSEFHDQDSDHDPQVVRLQLRGGS
ncbi:lamin tail domain-containing protein [Luteipulveratus flavus]|uniref:Lamin tail domain-containing protein n=1 Tax=Luteipulveratus flavus TaxID=3031728 RepID=A0ABT6CAF9_9MICO|nr:lamin tail domain-containing protein [Luteipulveratus sp. YIM 133296]MDF8265868.1 lamin tail domain-containing protein [Luteipulveratus sp. YIM 133296]